MRQTVICMKWGTRYGVEYLNRLASMIRRNTRRPTRIICFTDDPTGAAPGIELHPLPPIDLPVGMELSLWRKLSIWQAPLLDLEGDVLFIDLDMVITGSLDEFFDYEPGSYCVVRNWTQRRQGVGNTSVFRFPYGKMTYIFDNYVRDPAPIHARHSNEQQYISAAAHQMLFWPEEWCVSFKHSLKPAWPLNFFVAPKLPPETKLVAFTGKPDPDEALVGHWPVKSFREKLYKHVRPTPWIGEHWR